MDDIDRRALLGVAGFASMAALAVHAKGGPIDPPAGPVTSTGKTTQDVFDKIGSSAGAERIALSATNTPGVGGGVFTITAPGSYYLTGNLNVPGQYGINVQASNVTIDLNGYSIIGAPAGTSLSGVTVLNGMKPVRVHNGFVRSFLHRGINAASILERLHIQDCRYGAALLVSGGRVSDCVAESCGTVTPAGFSPVAAALRLFDRCLIERCEVRYGGTFATGDQCAGIVGAYSVARSCAVSGFGGIGIQLGSGSLVHHCSAISNSNTGIAVAAFSSVLDSFAMGNSGKGISVDENSLVARCTASGNNAGIYAHGAHVIDCCCSGNSETGIQMELPTNNVSGVIKGCVSNNNGNKGILVSGAGNLIIGNSCSRNFQGNWSIVAGNRGGTVSYPAAGAAVNGNTGALTPTTDPFGNWTF